MHTYKAEELVPKSGVYYVSHASHRLPAEVALLKGQRFPRCSQCYDEVSFAFIEGQEPPPDWTIAVHTLPVL